MKACRDPYPQLIVDLDKLRENLAAVIDRCHDSLVEVTGVVKGANALPEVARVFAESGLKYLATSRLDQVRAMRAAGIETPMMLIRIPMRSELPELVRLCDASLVSDLGTLRALNDEAARQGKVHRVMLMIDLGDLREGWWSAEELVDAAVEVERQLKSLHLLGVGVNLSCYGSVKPDKRNMQGLVSLAHDVEEAIGRELEYVSGGAYGPFAIFNWLMPIVNIVLAYLGLTVADMNNVRLARKKAAK